MAESEDTAIEELSTENVHRDVKSMVRKLSENDWEIPVGHIPNMRVPGRLFVSESLLKDIEPGTIDQIANVATLPGIQKYSMAMPDAHLGYGFAIGGVAAFDVEEGIISPGGVGFDINCGVRLIRTNLQKEDVVPHIKKLIDELFNNVPAGVGSKSGFRASDQELDRCFS